MPWQPSKDSQEFGKRWSTVAAKHLRSYIEAFKILSDMGTVYDSLNKLAQKATSSNAVMAELKQMEKKNGFELEVRTLPDALYAGQFLRVVSDGQQFLDLAFKNRPHGGLTHRYQWYVLAVNIDRLKLAESTSLCDLYKSLGACHAYRSDQNDIIDSVWKDVFDVPAREDLNFNKSPAAVQTARCPEYLMTFMQSQTDSAIEKLYLYSHQMVGVVLPPGEFEKLEFVQHQ
jgi:hypothetical protein